MMKQTWKNRLLILVMIAFGLEFSSCGDDYDDTWVRKTTADLEARVAALEEWQKNVNTQISSLQAIVAILEKKDYVTNVTPLANGTGYVISFQNSGDVTILNGEKGEKGDTGVSPVIGVKQDTDGKYYWTLNGEWLLDGTKKMPVTGEKGDTGETGDFGEKGDQGEKGADAIAPQVRINKETNMWEISTDDGKTWTSTNVKATGEKGNTGSDGDSMFSDIDVSNDDYIVLTLADGTTKIALPRYKGFLHFHYDYGVEIQYVVPGYYTYLQFYYPDNLTKDKFDDAFVSIVSLSNDQTTSTRAGKGWSVESINKPQFKEDGTLDTSKNYYVIINPGEDLEYWQVALVTIYLNYTNGKQETTTAFCCVYGPS